MNRRFLVPLFLLLPALSLAHGDEDHGAGATTAVLTEAAPRAEAQTELFEVLATPSNGQLVIYLDHSATNEPVKDARIEIESGTWKGLADAIESGTYHVAAPQFATPGSYPLLLTVTAGDDADLLETTLVVKPVAHQAAAAGLPSPSPWWWMGGALAALVIGAVSLMSRRKKTQ